MRPRMHVVHTVDVCAHIYTHTETSSFTPTHIRVEHTQLYIIMRLPYNYTVCGMRPRIMRYAATLGFLAISLRFV